MVQLQPIAVIKCLVMITHSVGQADAMRICAGSNATQICHSL